MIPQNENRTGTRKSAHPYEAVKSWPANCRSYHRRQEWQRDGRYGFPCLLQSSMPLASSRTGGNWNPRQRAPPGAISKKVIKAKSPYCRGIVLLGLDAPEDDLARAFATTAGHATIKGFAAGRTIFSTVAESWLAGKADDSNATSEMAERFANWQTSARITPLNHSSLRFWEEQPNEDKSWANQFALLLRKP